MSNLVNDVTDALGINTDDGGIGGVIGGALNLLTVGAGQFTRASMNPNLGIRALARFELKQSQNLFHKRSEI